jgi:hypothetical protein
MTTGTHRAVSMFTDCCASDASEAAARRTGFVQRTSTLTGQLLLALVTFGPGVMPPRRWRHWQRRPRHGTSRWRCRRKPSLHACTGERGLCGRTGSSERGPQAKAAHTSARTGCVPTVPRCLSLSGLGVPFPRGGMLSCLALGGVRRQPGRQSKPCGTLKAVWGVLVR